MLLDHKHLIVRAEVSDPPTNQDTIEVWLQKLIKDIRMKLVKQLPHNPISFYSEMEGNRGLTAVAIIETSHIAIHVWDEVKPALVQLDVYSCADFKPEEVFNHFNQFGIESFSYKFIDRNNGLNDIA